MTHTNRTTEHQIDSVYTDRWSTRAFSAEPIPSDVLLSAFEAARWAPSGGNSQPWRLVYVLRDTPEWERLFRTLNERNQVWASRASALVLFTSRSIRIKADGQPEPAHFHALDTGAAWSNFAHQLVKLGWSTRAIGGFNRDAARAEFAVPAEFELPIVVAVGKPTDASVLPEDLAKTDAPNGRLPLSQIVAEGAFNFA